MSVLRVYGEAWRLFLRYPFRWLGIFFAYPVCEKFFVETQFYVWQTTGWILQSPASMFLFLALNAILTAAGMACVLKTLDIKKGPDLATFISVFNKAPIFFLLAFFLIIPQWVVSFLINAILYYFKYPALSEKLTSWSKWISLGSIETLWIMKNHEGLFPYLIFFILSWIGSVFTFGMMSSYGVLLDNLQDGAWKSIKKAASLLVRHPWDWVKFSFFHTLVSYILMIGYTNLFTAVISDFPRGVSPFYWLHLGNLIVQTLLYAIPFSISLPFFYRNILAIERGKKKSPNQTQDSAFES